MNQSPAPLIDSFDGKVIVTSERWRQWFQGATPSKTIWNPSAIITAGSISYSVNEGRGYEIGGIGVLSFTLAVNTSSGLIAEQAKIAGMPKTLVPVGLSTAFTMFVVGASYTGDVIGILSSGSPTISLCTLSGGTLTAINANTLFIPGAYMYASAIYSIT